VGLVGRLTGPAPATHWLRHSPAVELDETELLPPAAGGIRKSFESHGLLCRKHRITEIDAFDPGEMAEA